MKIFKLRFLFIVLFISLFNCSIVLADEIPDTIRAAVESAVSKVKPALVRIHVVSTEYDEGREMKYESAGSGVIISKEGHVITNHHVAGHATRLVCTLSNKEEVEAELIGTDAMSDISVIKLKQKQEYPFVNFGDSSQVKVGDYVLAMGSPMALSQSVTLGIVSNTELIMPSLFWPDTRFTLDGEDVGSIIRWIGHDAAIYGGNSGGPLVNLKGDIIGINEIGIGLGGAIPGNLAKDVANKLIKEGKVKRSWLGIEIQPQLKNMEIKKGILISGTIKDSPADKAGFQSGDILIKLKGTDINVRFGEQMPLFNQMVADIPIGEEIEAIVLRNGKEEKLKVTTAEREEMRPKTYELKQWGITIRNISLLASKEMKRDNRDGALITSVRPGGPCGEAKPSINARDILVAVNDTPIKNIKDLMDLTDKITEGKTEPIPVLATFERKNDQYLTVVKVGIKEIEDPGLEVKKAWLPVSIQVLTRNLSEQMGITDKTGVRITQVYPNSSAEKAGLKVGDIIIALDGEKIPASQPEDYEVLPTMVRQYKVGTIAELTILRDKKEMKIPVELVRAPLLDREMKKFRDENFEFTVRDVAFLDKTKEDWKEDQEGVIVTEVKQGGWAALGHLGVEDLVLSVNEKKVTDVLSMEKIMNEIEKAKEKFVVIKVLRGIHTVYIELEPNWNINK